MAQSINIYISESGKVNTDHGMNESIGQVPSPEGTALEDITGEENFAVPEPEMLAGEMGEVGAIDDFVTPSPTFDSDFQSDSIPVVTEQLPMPNNDPSASISSGATPGPEDFDEGLMVEQSQKKTVASRTKKGD